MNDKKPRVIAYYSQSVTGCVVSSANERNSQRFEIGLTNNDDRSFLINELDQCDAVLTSFQTMRNERGALRTTQKKQIAWHIAVSPKNRSEVNQLGVWKQKGVPTHAITFGQRSHLVTEREFLCRLGEEGVSRLAFLGGPTLFRRFLRLQLIDEVCFSICPSLVGGPHTQSLFGKEAFDDFKNLALVSCEVHNNTIMARYELTTTSP